MRRRRAAERAVLAALVLLSAACGSRLPERDFEQSPPPTAAAAPLRIGIITSATSPVGEIGRAHV